jgi:hypothetical protein
MKWKHMSIASEYNFYWNKFRHYNASEFASFERLVIPEYKQKLKIPVNSDSQDSYNSVEDYAAMIDNAPYYQDNW